MVFVDFWCCCFFFFLWMEKSLISSIELARFKLILSRGWFFFLYITQILCRFVLYWSFNHCDSHLNWYYLQKTQREIKTIREKKLCWNDWHLWNSFRCGKMNSVFFEHKCLDNKNKKKKNVATEIQSSWIPREKYRSRESILNINKTLFPFPPSDSGECFSAVVFLQISSFLCKTWTQHWAATWNSPEHWAEKSAAFSTKNQKRKKYPARLLSTNVSLSLSLDTYIYIYQPHTLFPKMETLLSNVETFIIIFFLWNRKISQKFDFLSWALFTWKLV